MHCGGFKSKCTSLWVKKKIKLDSKMGVVKLLLNCKSVCSVPSFGASQREQKLDEEKLTPGIFMLIFYGHILHVVSVRVL